jgi:hypothetical protein
MSQTDVLYLAEEIRNRCLHLQLWLTDEAGKRLAAAACTLSEQLLAEMRGAAPMPETKPGNWTGD